MLKDLRDQESFPPVSLSSFPGAGDSLCTDADRPAICEQIVHGLSEKQLCISLLRSAGEHLDENSIKVAFPINVRLQPQISLCLSDFIIALKLTRSPSLRKRLEISLL